MTLRASPRFASGRERVGPTRSANHPLRGNSFHSVMHPLPGALPTRLSGFFCRVLLPGNLYWWRGASFDSSWSGGIFRFCSSLKGKEKGRTLTIQWRFVSCDPFLMPRFWRLMPGFSVLRAGYLVFGLLGTSVLVGFLTGGFIAGGGVLHDGVERLRGVVRAGCDGRFGGASGDGLGGCIG